MAGWRRPPACRFPPRARRSCCAAIRKCSGTRRRRCRRAGCASTAAARPATSRSRASGEGALHIFACGARLRVQHRALRLRQRRGLPALAPRQRPRRARRDAGRARGAHRLVHDVAPRAGAAEIRAPRRRGEAPLRRRPDARGSQLGVRFSDGAGAGEPARRGGTHRAAARTAGGSADRAPRGAHGRGEPPVRAGVPARQRAATAQPPRRVQRRATGGLGGDAVAGAVRSRGALLAARAAARRDARARPPAPAGRDAAHAARQTGARPATRVRRALRSRARSGLCRGAGRGAARVLRHGARARPQPERRAAPPRARPADALRGRFPRAGARAPVNEPLPLRELADAAPGLRAETPPASYAGRTRYTQLEYDALLANASIGIAFTRERRFFLTNPRFAEMFGYGPEELIGQPGEVVYPSRESYAALGQIAVPVLSSGRQLDLEWEMKRKDGSTFLARMIAKTVNPENQRQGTVWIIDDITDKKRAGDEMNRLLREQEAILQTVSIGILFVKDRRIMRCTRRFEEMYGYGPGELNGEPAVVLYSNEDDYQTVGQAYTELNKGMPFTMT